MDKVDFGKKRVTATDVSVVVSGQPDDKKDFDVGELRSFARQNRTDRKQSAKPKRDPVKDQLLVAGLIVGMLLLLGLVLVVAMKFSSIKEDEPAEEVALHQLFDEPRLKTGYDKTGYDIRG